MKLTMKKGRIGNNVMSLLATKYCSVQHQMFTLATDAASSH